MAASDFEYNNKDVNQIHGSFLSLVEDEKKGFWVGIASYAFTQGNLWKFTKITGFAGIGISLVAASVASNLYSHQSRATYARAAA